MNIKLNPYAAKRVAAGYPLIRVKDLQHFRPLPAAGELVRIQDALGNFLGHALSEGGGGEWAFRMLSRERRPSLDESWFFQKVEQGLALRGRLLSDGDGACRLINGENDGLPGIFCDKFGAYAVLDVLSPGALFFVPWVEAALVKKIPLKGLLRKVRFRGAGKEKTRVSAKDSVEVQLVFGEAPKERFPVREGEMRLWVDLFSGAHEGIFLDQRENRKLVAKHARGLEVLNCFCYTGSFSVACLLAGATKAIQVDLSQGALSWAKENMALNGLPVEEQEWHRAEVFEMLAYWQKKGRTFGLIIQDPPPFSRHKNGVFQAKKHYGRLAANSLRLLKEGGYLAAGCGVQEMARSTFMKFLSQAAVESHTSCELISFGIKPVDFPVLETYAEGDYQKFALLRVKKSETKGELTGI